MSIRKPCPGFIDSEPFHLGFSSGDSAFLFTYDLLLYVLVVYVLSFWNAVISGYCFFPGFWVGNISRYKKKKANCLFILLFIYNIILSTLFNENIHMGIGLVLAFLY